jgi:hypothetical protein
MKTRIYTLCYWVAGEIIITNSFFSEKMAQKALDIETDRFISKGFYLFKKLPMMAVVSDSGSPLSAIRLKIVSNNLVSPKKTELSFKRKK